MIALSLWSPLSLAAAGATLLGLGAVLLYALSLRPATRNEISAIWPEYRVLLLVFVGVTALVFLPSTATGLLLSFIAARIGWELAYALSPDDRRISWILAGLGAVWVWLPLPLTLLGLLWVAVALLRAFVRASPVSNALEVLLYPALPLLMLAQGASDPILAPALLAALLLSETFDSYSLLAGRLVGRTPLVPKLSPKKTIEGAVGGAVMLMATAGIAAALASDISAGSAIGAALLIGVTALAGDLSASRIKRRAGVKDYPSFLPPQGGLFDVLDGWIAASAALCLALAVF